MILSHNARIASDARPNTGPVYLPTLRTLPLVFDFVREMQELCPKALFINFSNPESRIILVFTRHFEIQLPKPIAIDCGSVENKFGAAWRSVVYSMIRPVSVLLFNNLASSIIFARIAGLRPTSVSVEPCNLLLAKMSRNML